MLVDIDPRQVAVPFANRISRTKVLTTMQASVDSIAPLVVDINVQEIGKTETGYVPSLIVVDGKHRHRAQVLCGRDRVSAWVGERALETLQARAATRRKFVLAKVGEKIRPLSKLEIEAAVVAGNPRMDTGDGGSIPSGPPHTSVRDVRSNAGGIGGPGGAESGLAIKRQGIFSGKEKFDTATPDPSDREFGGDPSDRGQMLDPSDKKQFSQGAPRMGDPEIQSPGSGVGPRVKPSTGASNSAMSRRIKAGPIKVKKIVTKKKKKMMAVAPPGREQQVLKLKEKFGDKSAMPYKIAWSQENKGKK